LWHGTLALDKPRNALRVSPAFSGWLTSLPHAPFGDLPKAIQTCLIRHDKSISTDVAALEPGPGEIHMTIMMPASDQAVLKRRDAIVAALRAIVPGEGVIDSAAEMLPYESDGLTAYRQPPMVVVLPDTTEQVSQVLKYCFEQGIKVVPRGAGTSLSGGALPLADGVLLGLGKFKRIREIDFDNRVVVTEPGVTNLAISQAVAHAGFYYAPDPSSQIACSIGGNVAENSGGVHCLKYGMTTNNVLGCEIVLITGEILKVGGKSAENSGYDLMGIITGSEGLLGVITEITVRILQKSETARALMVGFAQVEAAGECVARIIGAGIIPGGMEMMDKPAIHAAEAFVRAGYPLDVEALLIIELDGPSVEVDELISRVEAIAQGCGSTSCRISNSEVERNLFWAGRKAAFPAVGRISPDYLCMDGTIPRAQLPKALARIRELSAKYDLRVANVFHAGDGNLHPLILYDANKPGEMDRAEAFGADILRACVELGGVLTGEHGVGIEKRDLMGEMFNDIDLDQQQRLKCAFDARGLLNPGKVFPTLHRCAELGRVHVHGGKLAFPELPRF
jgi:glycolate oxidase